LNVIHSDLWKIELWMLDDIKSGLICLGSHLWR
jgi:hypothetical protein